MAVAKKYQQCDILGEPFYQNGRRYVTIETPFGGKRNVRWYSDAEYARMYNEPAPVVKTDYRKILGFGDAGYITIYYGDTYDNLDWFRNEPNCRYHKVFGWYTISTDEVPAELPDGVKCGRVMWDDVKTADDEIDEVAAKRAVEAVAYEPSESIFIGEIGERTIFDLTVKRTLELAGAYGISTMHIMEDANGNVFIWTTASKTLEKGHTYKMKGTIKDHRVYKNVQQTVLTRCSIIEK